MTKTKETGITLIALIITIIVMLILVGVTVAVALNGGLFTTAKNATNKYTVEKEKELITIGYSNYQMKKIAPKGEDTELLEKYFAKAIEDGITDDEGKFINNEIIPDAKTSLVILGVNENREETFVQYKNCIYKLKEDKEEINKMAVEYESTKITSQENTTDLELLKRYFLYGDKKIEEIIDNNGNFINDDIIPDAKSSLTLIAIGVDDEGRLGGEEIFVQYKNYIYKLLLRGAGEYDSYYESFETEEIYSVIADSYVDSYIVNYNEFKVQDANVDGNEDYGWTITFDGTGHVYTLLPDGTILEPEEPREKTDDEKLLEKYFLGEDEEKVYLFDILDFENNTFKNNEIVSDADSSITFFIPFDSTNKQMQLKDENDNPIGYKMYIRYKDAVYKATSIVVGEGVDAVLETKGLELIYSPTGREGQTVTYSYDGKKEHEEEWTILYDHGSTIEIVSPSTMGNLKLGADNWQDIDKAITSYNGAIAEVNKYCIEQITNNNKVSVRSAGSNPTNPLKENAKLYTSENLKNTEYDKKAKSSDDNWEQDYIRMKYWGILKSADTQTYWLASRALSEEGGHSVYDLLGLYNIDQNGIIENESLWYCGTVKGASAITNPVRPIVKIKQ